MSTEDDRPTVREFVAAHVADLHADLTDWLRIPSISAAPEHAADVRRSAEWLADRFRRLGLPTVEIWETAGHPAVFAEWPAGRDDAPTVLVYGHYDVQPVDPLDLWDTPPFEPTIRGEHLYARGAIDDKGQLTFHLLGMRAHLAATGRDAPAVNLRFLVEGEEESGSPNFAALLEEHRERLAPDVIVVSDTTMFSRETPSICTAMRGLVDCDLDVFGPAVDLHSGVFGGAIANPAHVLAALIASLHDADGRVAVDGFYDRVVPLSAEEREKIARLPFDEDAWAADVAGAPGMLAGEAGHSTLERIGARPTAEVNGLWGGYTGAGGKTIIPAHAHAKLSFRLVADQDPAEIQKLVREHMAGQAAAHAPDGIRVDVTFRGPGVRPCHTPVDHPATAAVVRAMERAFDTEILFTREGGSGPEADLADVLDAPVVFLGVGLPDDGFHAPNEKVALPLLAKGAEAAAYLWSELGEMPGRR
jgi:acetylornithine deacetylase/succinyl-diaminopimelate desuccinylase-like protein